ncbi:MAG: hypothetical protein PH343_03390 [Nitrospira sp.]|nr:hypothetical protein [Nitrospira sp.]
MANVNKIKRLLITFFSALVFIISMSVIIHAETMDTRKVKPKEHEGIGTPQNRAIKIEPKQYWYYEALKMLQDVKMEGAVVEGVFTERSTIFYFTVSKDKLFEPKARVEGYKMAIERIIGLMAPGAVTDNEANRKYLSEQEGILRSITGKELSGYGSWKEWFEANRNKLKWSEEKKMLVAD